MARTKYSPEERDKILVMFISAAREIILVDGIEQVTVRRIAEETGCNSARIYFYFKDLDQLITMACMTYLEKYATTLVTDLEELSNSYDVFTHSWEVFSVYAFTYPSIFYQIFFKVHNVSLNDMITEYYRLFPSQFDKISEDVKNMLLSGSLIERNMAVMKGLVDDGTIRKDNLEMINELMYHYFHGLLLGRMGGEGGLIDMERIKAKVMSCVKYLIDNERIKQ